jgi:hypothetical protein
MPSQRQLERCGAVLRAQEVGRLRACVQAVVNLSEDCLWNLLSSCSNIGALPYLLWVLATLLGVLATVLITSYQCARMRVL